MAWDVNNINMKNSFSNNIRKILELWHSHESDWMFTGWSDIGYNFLIGGDGRVYVGRDWDHIGAHTYGYNSKAVAFSLIGSFMNKTPSNTMLNTVHKLLACGISKVRLFSGRLRLKY